MDSSNSDEIELEEGYNEKLGEEFNETEDFLYEEFSKKSSTQSSHEEKVNGEFKLDQANTELFRSYDPSYENISLTYSAVCQLRLTENMKKCRKLFKSEIMKLTDEEISAFGAVRIRRLYKTGIVLPNRIFLRDDEGYTFKEKERLRYLMNNDVQ